MRSHGVNFGDLGDGTVFHFLPDERSVVPGLFSEATRWRKSGDRAWPEPDQDPKPLFALSEVPHAVPVRVVAGD